MISFSPGVSHFALHTLHGAAADAQFVRQLQYTDAGHQALPDRHFHRAGYLGPSDGLQPPALRIPAAHRG